MRTRPPDHAAGTAGESMTWRVRVVAACLIAAQAALTRLLWLRRLWYRARRRS